MFSRESFLLIIFMSMSLFFLCLTVLFTLFLHHLIVYECFVEVEKIFIFRRMEIMKVGIILKCENEFRQYHYQNVMKTFRDRHRC